jgi:polyhydroxybutyrate depolymerase
MKRLSFCLLFLFMITGCAQRQPDTAGLTVFNVDGVERHALIFPATLSVGSMGTPIVFAFHGHGGSAKDFAERLKLEQLYPEAMVVYMQGLTGVPGRTDPTGEKTGWQKDPDIFENRDVRFFEVALEQLSQTYTLDSKRVYLIGHSNGSRFVNVLWAMRGEKITALVSSSAQGGELILQAPLRPIFMLMGEQDPIVPYRNQSKSIPLVQHLLQTDASQAVTDGYYRTEPGINGTELVTYIHPGGHEFATETLPAIVAFFKRHSL